MTVDPKRGVRHSNERDVVAKTKRFQLTGAPNVLLLYRLLAFIHLLTQSHSCLQKCIHGTICSPQQHEYDNNDHATMSIKALLFYHNKALYTQYACSRSVFAGACLVDGHVHGLSVFTSLDHGPRSCERALHEARMLH